MKEILTKLLSKLPKGILVTLVISLGLIVARYWFNDYKNGQQQILNAVTEQGQKTDKRLEVIESNLSTVKADVSIIKNDQVIQNMQIDTITSTLNADKQNTLHLIKTIYQLKNEVKPEPKEREEGLSELNSKFEKIVTLNGDISNELKLPEPDKKKD